MKRNVCCFALLAIFMATLLAIVMIERTTPLEVEAATSPMTIDNVRLIFPTAKRLTPPKQPTGWVRVFDENGKPLGSIVCTSPLADSIRGYHGPTPLMIGINKSGKIIAVRPLPNSETSRYFTTLQRKNFFKEWNGQPWQQAANKRVDTITGATCSSEAVAKTLQKRLQLIETN